MAVDSILILLELDLLFLKFVNGLIILNLGRRKLVPIIILIHRPWLILLLAVTNDLLGLIVFIASSISAKIPKLICSLHNRPWIQSTIWRPLLFNHRARRRLNLKFTSRLGSTSQRLVMRSNWLRSRLLPRPNLLFLLFFLLHLLFNLSISRDS